MKYKQKVKEVEDKLDGIVDRNICPNCGSIDCRLENYDMMWHDGDVVCNKCNTRIRTYDAG